ncbi:flavin reductase family protein [uncultured Arthrobacter sp.]|uniref:flavin reductase family protein n=1 Tax=uncultured Arthrobacter sp. TaxID=114050 RepID=UPI0025E03F31|nr:flavin reductase family protein [uncultured Arthrobacter sp.]
MRSMESADLSPGELFKLLTGAVVPRPIAWTSTISEAGINNLSPFSFFTVVSSEPPMLLLSLEYKEGGWLKDSAENIEKTGEFVVNIVSSDMAGAVNISSRPFPAAVDEFTQVEMTPLPSLRVRPPRVQESLISMECVLHSTFHPGSDRLVVGEIVVFHVAEQVLMPDGRIDVSGLDPLGRVANQFTYTGPLFSPPR